MRTISLLIALTLFSPLAHAQAPLSSEQAKAEADASEPINMNAEDMIGAQPPLARIIGEPLSPDELRAVLEGIWKAEINRHATTPTHFQQMAWEHLVRGGALRAGDFVALHGSLLSALQPNTYALAKKWQKLMGCVPPKEAGAECYGY